jgi:hypothetical protein
MYFQEKKHFKKQPLPHFQTPFIKKKPLNKCLEGILGFCILYIKPMNNFYGESHFYM